MTPESRGTPEEFLRRFLRDTYVRFPESGEYMQVVLTAALREAEARGAAAEREACARLATEVEPTEDDYALADASEIATWDLMAQRIAAAIRARGG